MNTLKPFHVLDAEEYARKRHRPLFVTVTEPDVNELFKPMGLTFADFLAAAMPNEIDKSSQSKDRCRLVEDSAVRQVSFDEVVSDIKRDVTLFSQSFIFEDFEKEGKVSPELSPIPARFPERIVYGSSESMDPPWYRWSLEKLLEAEMFANYDFCDFPFCILYGTTKSAPPVTCEQLRARLRFPTWMSHFVSQIPVVKIVVVDAAYEAEGASQEGGFNMVLCLPIRAPGQPLDPVDVRQIFRFDDDILLDKDKGARFSMEDFERGQTVMKAVKAYADIHRTEKLEQLKKEDNKKKNLKNRLKSLVKKKKGDELYLGIQEKKIRHLRLASMLFVDGRAAEAKKTYKYFVKSLKGSFVELRVFGKFMATLCTPLTAPLDKKKVKEEAVKVLKAISSMKENVVFMITVPLLFAEFAARQGELTEAISHLNFALTNVFPRLSGRPGETQLLEALVYERMAGLTREQKKVMRHTFTAEGKYERAGDTGNALRCAIWLEKALDHNTWKFLYQGQWLKKVKLLETVGQVPRAYKEVEAILSIPDLDPSLHMEVYYEFMKPVKECIANSSTIQIDTLLSVSSTKLVHEAYPEWWGYMNGEFRVLIDDMNEWSRKQATRSLSMEEYWNGFGKNTPLNVQEVPIVVLGTTISVVVVLHNRYLFDIDLTRADIEAVYEGDPEYENPFIITLEPDSPKILKPGSTTLVFKIDPKAEGTYTVKSIKVRTWTAVQSVMEIGPLTFRSIRDYPRVQMMVKDFPRCISAGECVEFSVVVRNIGTCTAPEVILWYGNSPFLCALTDEVTTEPKGSCWINIANKLEPGEEAIGTFMCRSDDAGVHGMSFMVSVQGKRRIYRRETYSVAARLRLEARIAPNPQDTDNKLIHVTVRSYISNLKVIGVMNQNGRLLKTMKVPDVVVNPGQTFSLSAFVCDELDETVEPWRTKMMCGMQYALLLDFGTGSKYFAQVLLRTGVKFTDNRFSFEMHPDSTISAGTKVTCILRMTNRASDRPVFVEPLPITFVDNNNRIVTFSGCKWVGVTKKKLCPENDFTCEFSFLAVLPGCYQVSSFVWSYEAHSMNRNQATITHFFRVAPKPVDLLNM